MEIRHGSEGLRTALQRSGTPELPRGYHQDIEEFCNCEMPECLDNMIQCDGCEEWFHMSCVGLEIPPPETEPWHCCTLCNACI